MNNLAGLLQAMGDYAAAEPLYRRALAIAEKAQGPEHPETGVRLGNLAGLLQDMGDYAAAEPLFQRALAIAEKAGDQRETARLWQTIAVMVRDAGQPDRALPDFQRALSLCQQIYGAKSLQAASAMSGMGQCMALLGHHFEAIALFKECLAIREDILPADDELIALVKSRLAAIEPGAANEGEAKQP
jgi:tetratricopeptide (TPR) repeat protein